MGFNILPIGKLKIHFLDTFVNAHKALILANHTSKTKAKK